MALYGLKGKQAKLLKVLINPENQDKSVTEICSIAGIGRQTYYRAMKDEIFQNALEKAHKDLLSISLLPITHQIVKRAKKESFQDRKMVLEILGIYNPKLIHQGDEEKPLVFVMKLTNGEDRDKDELHTASGPEEAT